MGCKFVNSKNPMSNATNGNTGCNFPERLFYPDDEKVHPWLGMLLDAFVITDEGVEKGIEKELRRGRKLACGKGCSACCRTHKTIPVYPLELVGISWYVTEKLCGVTRDKLKAQLRSHKKGEVCPFLVNDLCSIHAVRPLACRQFNVFDTVCKEGEDAYYTRRQDVLTPLQQYVDKAFYRMLPFYGVQSDAERHQAIKSGDIHQVARVLQDFDWSSLAGKMDQHDERCR